MTHSNDRLSKALLGFAMALTSVAVVACSARTPPAANGLTSPQSAAASTVKATSVASTPWPSGIPKPPSTPVPAPGGGNVDQTVPAKTITTRSPVALTESASLVKSVTAKIQKIVSTQITAETPGVIAGGGLAVTVQITNSSKAKVPLNSISVTMSDASGSPLSYAAVSTSIPFAGMLSPGKSATGTYVFNVANTKPAPVTIAVMYAPATSVVLFKGTAG
jgi:hypothetical protein